MPKYHFQYDLNEISNLILDCGMRKKQIVDMLINRHNGPRPLGLSIRTLERFCQENQIRERSPLNENELDAIVGESIERVGPSSGYRTLQGLLRSEGHTVCGIRLRKSMNRYDPMAVAARRTGANLRLNPKSYHAPYPLYNVHFDQNEKVSEYPKK